MENVADALVANVPKRGGVARDALADAGLACACGTLGTDASAALANAKAEPICAAVIVVMTGPAGDILVAAEDFVVEKQLPDPCLLRIAGMKLLQR
mgnify:CR=1 FL=1